MTKQRAWQGMERRLLSFFLANSLAETVQVVAMVWATYALTHDARLVGIVNAAAYLPGVVVGLFFQRRADAGSAARLLSMTNWVLFLSSLALTAVWLASNSVPLVVVSFVVFQVSLSVVKMVNKAYVGRVVRDGFEPRTASRVLQRATSLTLVGGMVGGGAVGVLLDLVSPGWAFAAASVLYLASLYAISADAARAHPATEVGSDDEGAETLPPAEPDGVRRSLALILLFSVPSSGALPFISTAMVPYANQVAQGSGLFYSVLTVTVMCGGFVAGMALSTNRLTLSASLRWMLGAGGVLAALLPVVRWPPLVVGVVLVLAVALTAHVISMQVLTNQAPPPSEVGRFIVLRNSVAGTAKGVFSLLAGWIIDVAGLDVAWLSLAVVLLVFAGAWVVSGRRVLMVVGAQ